MTMNCELSVPSTVSLDDVAARTWDVIVVGAGPSGSIAASEAAGRGLRVLMIDRRRFPRSKVCGCCLNRAALDVLQAAGLEEVIACLRSVHVKEYQIACQGQAASIAIPDGLVVTREELDARLVLAAVENGAHFLDATRASVRSESVDDAMILMLKQGERSKIAQGRITIVATGLGPQLGANGESVVSPRSRVGISTIVSSRDSSYESGVIYMACGKSGYAGIVRLDDESLNIAAALDPSACKPFETVGRRVNAMIRSSGLTPCAALDRSPWHATPLLTQRPVRVFGKGHLCVGDAAGYVEPFTGEGIAWAMATGRAVVPFAMEAMTQPMAQVGPRWQREHRRIVGRRRFLCRSISQTLRRPQLVALAVRCLRRFPRLAIPVERSLNLPFRFTNRLRV